MDSTLLYADSLLRQPGSNRFTVVVNAPFSSPLNSPRSPVGSPTKTQQKHFQFPDSPSIDSKKTSKSSKPTKEVEKVEDKKSGHISLREMKRKLFTKLFRVLTLKDITSGNKTYPRDFRAKHASAKRKRARSSQSSGLSHFEPLPTIVEEEECDLASLQSTIHQNYGSVYGTYDTLINQRQFIVDATA
jgi:hypothetical protein